MKDFNTEEELNDEKIPEYVESHKKTLGFLKTITDAEQGIGISKRYSDIDEMFEDLNKD